MDRLSVLVISDPAAAVLRLLERLPASVAISVSERPESFSAVARDASVILAREARLEAVRAVWNMAPNVRWVHSLSAGVNNYLFPEFVASPVPLTNSRGVFSRALAEFVMAAVLHFSKDLRRMIRNQQAGVWERFGVEEVFGKVMGIVGYGSIGQAIAARARDFGMKVLALRRSAASNNDPYADEILPPAQLLTLMERSDYVAIATPLTPETRGLVGEAALRAMKTTGVLINVGRGPTVDEAALIAALQENRIRGAALDVFDVEPLPGGHAFYGLDNVLLSPHCADHTPGWEEAAMELFLENFERFRHGEPLKNVVDKKLGY